MKLVVQRVSSASVKVDEKIIGEINNGLLIFLGVFIGDTVNDAEKLIRKTPYLRIFKDENDKMNKSLLDIDGEALVISQFTLCADTTHGRRPSFIKSALPKDAKKLYDYFISRLLESGIKKVDSGEFGADMKIELLNDGPVTIILDSKEL